MLLQVQDPALLDLYAGLLSPEEQQHVKAATSQAARKERLLARALQRSVLSRSAATSEALVGRIEFAGRRWRPWKQQ